MNEISETVEIARQLKQENKDLTSWEALDVATKIRANQQFYDAFIITNKGAVPLEAMAMALGYNGTTIPEALGGISDSIADGSN